MKIPSREELQRIREQYPVGARVKLIRMNDPYNRSLRPGCEGTVAHVDDMATVFVKWDCGSGLSVIIGEDQIEVICAEGGEEDG